MAHPADRLVGHILKKHGALINLHPSLSVFADRSRLHTAAEKISHQLRAVADPQNRNAHFKNLPSASGSAFPVNTVRASRKNNAFGIHLLQTFQTDAIGVNLTVNITFPNPSCNQLIILTAKIKHNDHFLFHTYTPPPSGYSLCRCMRHQPSFLCLSYYIKQAESLSKHSFLPVYM